ncbi:MAG: cystathionine beta-lyase [Pseudomonadota bacterium]
MKKTTLTAVGGRDPARQAGAVSPGPVRASTIVAPTLAEFDAMKRVRPGDGLTYALHGTPGVFAFEEALAALEGGGRSRVCPSGLMAITAPLLCFLSPGDHLLITDAVYEPARKFCEITLKRFGVETTFYDPLLGEEIAALMRPETKVVFLESPSSLTFEVQDVPALARAAKARGAVVMMDNTWASPLYFQPLAHGVDVSIQALTKYVGGHSDMILGAVTATDAVYPTLQKTWRALGVSAGPDEVYLAHRGLASLPMRMAHHHASGLKLAAWLQAQPEVLEVVHPGLPEDPGHALWRRDFSGAGGLFAFTLDAAAAPRPALAALLDGMRYFKLGFSWGGIVSMLTPSDPRPVRSAGGWPRAGRADGQLMRVFAGLEDPEDLIEDLDAGFARLRAAAR